MLLIFFRMFRSDADRVFLLMCAGDQYMMGLQLNQNNDDV
jgi:hypothetical protein